MEDEYMVFRRYGDDKRWEATTVTPRSFKGAKDEVESIHKYSTSKIIQTKIMILRELETQ